MITSLIVMLELPNFYLYDHIWNILRRPAVANFADIIKIPTMFLEKAFQDSKKFKGIRDYVSKCSLFLYFLV